MSDTLVEDTADPLAPNSTGRHWWLVVVLRFAAGLCFAGWAWKHLYWEGPLGVLLWQDSTFELAESFGITWEQFVGTGANDGLIQRLQRGAGWVLLLSTIATILLRRKAVLSSLIILAGTVILGLIFYAKFINSQEQLPMLVEHGGQLLAPACLWLAINFGTRHAITIAMVILAVILTFAGHGCYALGLWPTPATFYAMTTVVLGTELATTEQILFVAGILDFVVCIGLFIPYLRIPLALYACLWGFLTAIARPVAGMSVELNYWGADQYLHEAVLRAPHFILPMYLVLAWTAKQVDFEDTPSDTAEPHD